MDLVIKGFIIGIGKIIPGVSGAMLAITLGVYEPLLDKLVNLRKNFFANAFYLTKIGIGVIIAIIMTSKIIVKCLNNYYFPTMLLFIGMIIGGTREITKDIKFKKRDFLIVFVVLFVFLILSLFTKTPPPKQVEHSFLFFMTMIGIGFLDAASSIIPGISGTALLMTLGYYNIVLNMFGTILNMSYIRENLFVALPFSIGIILGIVVISIVLNYLFKNHKNITYMIILILIMATTFILVKNTFSYIYTLMDIMVGIPLFMLGFITSLKLGKN